MIFISARRFSVPVFALFIYFVFTVANAHAAVQVGHGSGFTFQVKNNNTFTMTLQKNQAGQKLGKLLRGKTYSSYCITAGTQTINGLNVLSMKIAEGKIAKWPKKASSVTVHVKATTFPSAYCSLETGSGTDHDTGVMTHNGLPSGVTVKKIITTLNTFFTISGTSSLQQEDDANKAPVGTTKESVASAFNKLQEGVTNSGAKVFTCVNGALYTGYMMTNIDDLGSPCSVGFSVTDGDVSTLVMHDSDNSLVYRLLS